MRMRSPTQIQTQSSFTAAQTGILQRKCASCGQHTIAGGECSECQKKRSPSPKPISTSRLAQDFSRVPIRSTSLPVIQTKLTVRQPDDKYEQKINRGFKQIIQSKLQQEIASSRDANPIPAVGSSLASITPSSLFEMATKGEGTRVPYQADMEVAFGESFEGVRAYLGRSAPMEAIRAVAATRGEQIAFRDSYPSRETVAHELVHVVQSRCYNKPSIYEPTRLSTPNEAAEREADYVARRVVLGQEVRVTERGMAGIKRQQAARRPTSTRLRPPGSVPEFPTELREEITVLERRTNGQLSEEELRRIGRHAVALLGTQGVTALAKKAGIPGAERRQREAAEEESEGVIHRQAAEAAAGTAGTMWWLTLVDGPLPVGDIIYGALIVGAAIVATATVSEEVVRCRRVKAQCIDECTEELPTRDNGFSFWRCLNACLGRHACLGIV